MPCSGDCYTSLLTHRELSASPQVFCPKCLYPLPLTRLAFGSPAHGLESAFLYHGSITALPWSFWVPILSLEVHLLFLGVGMISTPSSKPQASSRPTPTPGKALRIPDLWPILSPSWHRCHSESPSSTERFSHLVFKSLSSPGLFPTSWAHSFSVSLAGSFSAPPVFNSGTPHSESSDLSSVSSLTDLGENIINTNIGKLTFSDLQD